MRVLVVEDDGELAEVIAAGLRLEGMAVDTALDGDAAAVEALVETVYEPLLAGGTALLDTLTTYLEQGSSLEGTARMLFVHPNTVRYRLRRVTELTGFTPAVGRDGHTLWTAIALGRLAARRG